MSHLNDFILADSANVLDTEEAIAGRAAALELDQKEHWANYYAALVTLWETLSGTTDEKLVAVNAKLADLIANPKPRKIVLDNGRSAMVH